MMVYAAHITVNGVTLPPTGNEVRIQIATDRLLGEYLLLVLTDEGIITDLVNEDTGEVVATDSEMWDDLSVRLA